MEDEMIKKLLKLKENLLYDFRSIKQKNTAVMNYINEMIIMIILMIIQQY